MKRHLRILVTAFVALLTAAVFSTPVYAQYADGYQINVVQQQVRTRIVNDLRGTGHEFDFDNNAVVASSGSRNSNRVSGTGRHRYNRSGWQRFSYEGTFNLRSGTVSSVDYRFGDGSIGGFPPGNAGANMTWSGRVDAVARIRVVGRQAFVNTITGRPVTDARYDFKTALPRGNVNVEVYKTSGRGTVTVIEQPSPSNNHSAVIEIRDPSGGDDYYSFDLSWGPDGPNPPIGGGQMNWQGNVDATVRVTIRGRNAVAQATSGREPTAVLANFQNALPRRPVNVSVRTIEGRGTVRVIQQPSRLNGFSAVIEINDPRGGSDRYAFEAEWDAFGGGRPGDDDAKMTWTGRVDGTARVTVRGRNASVREIQTGVPVDNVSYDFFEDLPRRPVNVRLNVVDGRGRVAVVSQPSASNRYTAEIEISDPLSGSDFYTFELDWTEGGSERPPVGGGGQMTWEGNVDATVQITLRGRDASVRTLSGRNPTGVRYNFNDALPRRPVNVSVRQIEGRGNVRVIQQPSRLNGFSAIIEVNDPRGGDDRYAFEVDWDRFGGGGNDDDDRGGKIVWRGNVDALATISISDRYVVSQAMSGQPLSGVSYDISQPLPRDNVRVRVDKREGRDDVRVIQQPNRLNNFTTIIQINDSSGGRDYYEIEIDW